MGVFQVFACPRPTTYRCFAVFVWPLYFRVRNVAWKIGFVAAMVRGRFRCGHLVVAV